MAELLLELLSEEIPARMQDRAAADLKRLADILRKANYQGYVVLEYEAAEDPYAAIPPLLKKLRGLLA